MIGQQVAQYRIVEELGAGSTGAVYRAEDTRLGRTVALKFLHRDLTRDRRAKDRFLREARAASRLDHPNICTIHEVGETDDGGLYIVMAFYRGETLSRRIERGPLPIEEAVAIARQIASGLAEAHAEDVVHRDVKPANVLLAEGASDTGRVKILDFGLAKVIGDATLTREGASLGTPVYMSPEHVQGEVDARSDLWALGVMLHEMLSGKRPFSGDHPSAVLYSILHREPPPIEALRPETPAWLASVVERLLVKDPRRRLASAEQVVACLAAGAPPPIAAVAEVSGSPGAIRSAPVVPAPAPSRASDSSTVETWIREPPARRSRLGLLAVLAVALITAALAAWLKLARDGETPAVVPSPAAAGVPAICVLPFDDLSPDPGPGFFADGLTEALITDLGKVSGLRVISRASAMTYRGTSKPPRRIARELGVDYLLSGSVVRAASQVRISAQLVDGALDQVLWSESYERPLRGVLELQSEVARAVARQIEVRLTPLEASALSVAATVEPRALELYLMGRAAWNERTTASIRRGIELFEQALEIDPSFALAHVGLAESFHLLGDVPFYDMPSRQADELSESHARRALELDPTLGQAYATLGLIDAHRYDWRGAEARFRCAFELAPSYATAYQWYGETRMIQRHWEEAEQALRKAELLDPLSPVIQGQFGRLLINRRRYAEAAEYFRRILERQGDFWLNHYGLASALLGLGEPRQALAAIERAGELSDGSMLTRVAAANIRASAGDPGAAKALLREVDRSEARLPPTLTASLATSIGDVERALGELERGLETGDPTLSYIATDAVFDPLRGDPRFRAVLEGIGLDG